MAKNTAVEPMLEERKPSAHIELIDRDMLEQISGDLELEEEITITIKGKITGLRIEESKHYPCANLDLEVKSINGSTVKDDEQKEEMDAMDKHSKGK